MMRRHAALDSTRKYRYALERTWNADLDRVLFIMLNPSTADEHLDDATIRRCIRFASTWGYGGLTVGNLFALRSTDPSGLIEDPDPVGPGNDHYLERMAGECRAVVAAWGNSGTRVSVFQEREAYIKERLTGQLQCLGVNKDGTPRHPAHLDGNTPLQPFA